MVGNLGQYEQAIRYNRPRRHHHLPLLFSHRHCRYLLHHREYRQPVIMEIIVYGGDKGVIKNPQNFTEAFETENGDLLNKEAQELMFTFVEKGYRTGLSGITFRVNKGTRNLRLGDRATAPKGEKLLSFRIRKLVKLLRAIKADDVSPRLNAEFNTQQANPQPASFWSEK